MQLLRTAKATKQAARYTPAGGRERCLYCRWYASPNICGRIIGPVSPMGWCKYYAREMVQPPGRRVSNAVSGGIASDTALDISFITTPGTLDPRLTFTRASTATYFAVTGTMQTAATNAPRFDCDPVTHAALGLLIEEQRQNGIINSGAMATSWTTTAGSWVAGATLAPDGTNSGALFKEDATASPHSLQCPMTITTPVQWTFSVYAKAAGRSIIYSGGAGMGGQAIVPQWNLAAGTDISTGANANFSHGIQSVGNGWYRCWFSLQTSATSGLTFNPALTPGGGNAYQGDNTSGVYFWGAQGELGAFPTSYIPTTGAAVTRAQEQAILSTAGWMTPPGGSWAAEFVDLMPTANNARIVGSIGAGTPTPLFITAALALATVDNAPALVTGNSITVGAISKGASTYNAGAGTVCLNAGTVVAGAQGTGFSPAQVALLQNVVGPSNNNMTGYIRRVRYWQRALSNAELQAVTT